MEGTHLKSENEICLRTARKLDDDALSTLKGKSSVTFIGRGQLFKNNDVVS